MCSLYKPSKGTGKKKIIEEILKDLDPGIREEARRILEEFPPRELLDREKIFRLLKRRGLPV